MAVNWLETIKQIAPTVASAFLGPLGGIAVSAVGNLMGVSDATQDKIATALQSGQMTPEQVTKLKELELTYQANERERDFRYSELAFKDRDSARTANVSGGTQKMLFGLSIFLLLFTLCTEVAVLFYGYPANTPEIVVGRVLGLMDAIAMMIISYWFGTSSSSRAKDSSIELILNKR